MYWFSLNQNEIIWWYLKQPFRKFCLFVAIYVWKSGIAVTCGIIFCAWVCSGTAPARMNLMFWGEYVAV